MATPDDATPFYVACDVCLNCGMASTASSEIWAWDDRTYTCSIARQPETEQEVYEAIRAAASSCVEAVMYQGDDDAIKRRLAAIGLSSVIEGTAPDGVALELRRFATFRRLDGDRSRDLLRLLATTSWRRPRAVWGLGPRARTILRWKFGGPGVRLSLGPAPGDGTRWLFRLRWRGAPTHSSAVLHVACDAHDVLCQLGSDRDARWYAGDPVDRDWPAWSRFPL